MLIKECVTQYWLICVFLIVTETIKLSVTDK